MTATTTVTLQPSSRSAAAERRPELKKETIKDLHVTDEDAMKIKGMTCGLTGCNHNELQAELR
jgi:hypothetical protein